jgi:alcohol dehydrogenase class IV
MVTSALAAAGFQPAPTGGCVAWHNPTRVVFGAGALAEVGRECAQLGATALLVVDGGLPHVAARAEALLRAAGVRIGACQAVEPSPSRDTAGAVAARTRAAGADLVLGLGGGSTLDVAKVAAAAARNPELIAGAAWGADGLVAPALARPRRGLPLVAVPTTAATGSEVNPGASLVDPATGRKQLLLHPVLQPRVALVDPELACSLSPRATAEGSAATVARLLVPYTTETQAMALQDLYAEATLRLVLELTPRALGDGGDVEARAGLALAATSSMLGWTTIGRNPLGNPLWFLQNALTPLAGAAKGAACAALLPGYLRFALSRAADLPGLGDPVRIARLGHALFRVLDAASAVDRLVGVLESWSLPTRLSDIGVNDDQVPVLAAETVAMWGGALPWLRLEDAAALYRAAL